MVFQNLIWFIPSVPDSMAVVAFSAPITPEPQKAAYIASKKTDSVLKLQTEDKAVTLGEVVRRTVIETDSPEYKANLARFARLTKEYSKPKLINLGELSGRSTKKESATCYKVLINHNTDEKGAYADSRDASQDSNAEMGEDFVPDPNILTCNKFKALVDPVLLQNEVEVKEVIRLGHIKNSRTKKRIIPEEGYLSYSNDPATWKSIPTVTSKSYHGRYVILGHTGEL
ncbi:unnamed protein product [Cuscuta campestris]|uniref:Uncharacterized protein n=1 Tax=Cuscuta campestris TaxID=132261 RepID=A0A484NFS6_9ASTE|nr:unnamed protein product [Cuscuta campestris]